MKDLRQTKQDRRSAEGEGDEIGGETKKLTHEFALLDLNLSMSY